jgi:tetratricopeptide (TPR) repeat protein
VKTLAGYLLMIVLACITSASFAASGNALADLQQRWAEVNYQLEDKQQLDAFADLLEQADEQLAQSPDNAELLIWRGIIKSTYAGAKGGLGALSLAKSSRADFEQALAIDPDALEGSAYTSLGTLYFSVPGWPIGFGDSDKAAELLQKALQINPQGIDSNYFFAEYLRKQGENEQAMIYYHKAQQAPARPDRPLADAGRQEDISRGLAMAEARLH